MPARGQRGRFISAEPGKPPAPGEIVAHDFKISLNAIAKHCGGKSGFIDAARLSREPIVKAVVDLWDALNKSQQAKISLEELCDKAGSTDHGFVLGEVVAGLWSRGVDVTKMIVALQLPAVMEKTVDVALTDGGHRERNMLLKGAGFLPRPVHNQYTVFETQARQQLKEVDPIDVPSTPGLPAIEDGNAVDAQFEDLDPDG